MSQTNTPSGADVDPLAVLNDRITDRRFALSAAIGVHGMSVAAEELRKAIAARTAVAALIARNAELEAERDEAREWRRDVCERLGLDCAQGAEWAAEDIWGVLLKEVERGEALAAENLALQFRLSGLADHCRRVYDIVPALPIDERSTEGATDALHAFCIMLGVNGIDIDAARTPAATTKGNDND